MNGCRLCRFFRMHLNEFNRFEFLCVNPYTENKPIDYMIGFRCDEYEKYIITDELGFICEWTKEVY